MNLKRLSNIKAVRLIVFSTFTLIAVFCCGLGYVRLRTGINPLRVWYFEYLEQHHYSKPFEDALREADVSKIAALLQQQPDLVDARFVVGDTPLHKACGYANSTNILALLLKSGAEVNIRNFESETPLHEAVLLHDPAAELFLLSNGADWALEDSEGFTPLDRAVRHCYKDIVGPLLAKGATVNIYDAILMDDRQVMAKLLSADPSLVNQQCVSDAMPICIAAGAGLTDMVELLLEHGANVDGKDDSPLCLAAASGHFDTVKLLLDRGANVNARDLDGRTALWLATGRLKTMQLLLSKGADINASSDGITALERAAAGNFLPAASPPLHFGTSGHPAQKFFQPPLHSLEGIRPKLLDYDGRTYGENPVKILLAFHANPNQRDKSGRTALHGAWSREVAELLIKAGADINARDNAGRTPLRFALRTHNTEVAAFLRECGAKE